MKKAFLCTLAVLLALTACSCTAETVCTCASVTDAEASAAAYARFSQAGELSVIIPGLKEGFVPQGIISISTLRSQLSTLRS